MPEIDPAQSERGPKALLDDYATIARRRGTQVLERTALRTRSFALRDLLAHLASNGRLDYRQVVAGEPADWDAKWIAALGKTVALQGLRDSDLSDAVPLLRRGISGLPEGKSREYRKLLAEVLFALGEHVEVKKLVDEDPYLQAVDYGYLETDLLNPFIGSPFGDEGAWWARFSRFFSDFGVEPPGLSGEAEVPFDRLQGVLVDEVEDGPLVSVIMTTFRSDRIPLLTSVRSILEQSWRNLELIVVDDCSPPEYADVLAEIEKLDPRISVHRLPKNRGTYAARNVGIALAKGAYITGQDSDDWSHPERIARQVAPLEADPSLPASRCKSVTVREDMLLQRLGIPVTRGNASSLMLRRDVAEEVGGFLPSRKGVDSELHARIDVLYDTPVLTLDDPPLTIVRIRSDSLSRAEFAAFWRHPVRSALIDAYRHWHHTREVEEIRAQREPLVSPIPIPAQFAVDRVPPGDFDVVFAGDWREYGGPQRSMIEEIKALRTRGLRIGILHLEAARFMTRRNLRLCAPIMEMLHRGEVTRLVENDVNRVHLLVLRYPPILQFPPDSPVSLDVERLIILANQAPAERDGSDIRYEPSACSDHAEHLFGVRGLWVPQGPTVRAAITGLVDEDELADFDMPGLIDVDAWATERASFRSTIPVIGRHSRDTPMKWPRDAESLVQVYPTDGSVEVRSMGGTTTIRNLLDGRVPPTWLAFEKDELDIRTFLNSIDFFVYYQHPDAYDAFGRAPLEALATGCVAILPHHLEPTFGDAAIYADESEALRHVRSLYARPAAYRAQSKKALEVVRERFGYSSYADRVETLLARDTLLSRS